MPERATVKIWLNGSPTLVTAGSMASAAFLNSGTPTRLSHSGELRSALCGMGICFECRAIVDGIRHRRTCQIVCQDGMRLESQP